MSVTVAEVKNIALRKLGVLRVGQTARAQDTTQMTQAYNSQYAFFKRKGWATWASAGPLPDEVAEHVASLMAFRKINDYSVSDSRYQRITNEVAAAIPAIRDFTSEAFKSQEDPVDF